MARRDVDLVIKARDEAQGTIRAITGALQDFVKGQKAVKGAASDTDSALTRLSTGLKNLQSAAGGLDVGDRLDRSLSKSAKGILGLVDAVTQARRELAGYQAKAAEAARATEALRAESERVANSVKQQKAAVEQARDAQSRLNQITRDAAKERARLVEADRKLTAQIEAQRTKLNGLAAEFDKVAAEIAATEKPTAALVQRLESLDRRGHQAEATFRKMEQTQADIRASIDETARSVARANDLYGAQAASLDRQVAALDQMGAEQRRLGAALKATEKNQADLKTETDRAAATLQKQVAALERSKVSFEGLQGAAAETSEAMSRVERTVRGPMLKAFGDQKKLVAALGADYRQARAEATRLGAAIAKLGDAASDELVAEFTRAQEASVRTEKAWHEQAQAANRMRAILRETGGDLDAVEGRFRRFASVLASGAAGYERFSKASRAAAQAQASAAQQAARATQGLTGATRAQGAAAAQAARQTGVFAAAIRQFYGDSRTALSFTQRLRSEVLSLIAAYGGIFAAIEGVRRVVDAFQTLEAAQSRLGTVFKGDQTKVAAELDFIRRNAERLGIEFGLLSDEYTKFAVATKGTNLEGAETRRIFIKVAEAARVMRLSNENVQGVFVALGQIASKGAVQMEELRQQLGDRLPGALQIMAAGLRVGSDKLIEMLENGEVTSDALSGFADELDRRFGKQVPEALETVSAALGRFQNAVFQAFLRIAEGGFMDRFSAMLNDITETLQSADFRYFADQVSAALGTMADFLALVARNWGLVTTAVGAFVGYKLAPFLAALVTGFGGLRKALPGVTSGFRVMNIALTTSTTTAARLSGVLTGLRIALVALISSTGIGLLVAAIGAGIGAWAASADDATQALTEHERLLDEVRNAYERVGGSAEKWTKEIKKFQTEQDVRENLKAQNKLYEDAIKAFNKLIEQRRKLAKFAPLQVDFFKLEGLSATFQADGDAQAFLDGVREFFNELRDIADTPEEFQFAEALAKDFNVLSKALAAAGVNARDAQLIFDAWVKTGGDLEAALELINRAADGAGEGLINAAERAEKFEEALNELKEFAPELAAELEDMQEAASLEAAYQSALRYASSLEQVERAEVAYQAALKARQTEKLLEPLDEADGDARAKAAALLRKSEGFRSKAYWDENHWRVGYGSDTIRGGEKVTELTRATLAEAEAELLRRIDKDWQRLIKQIGEVRLESFGENQQAVLLSLAYNYGDLARTGILDVIRKGTEEEIAKAIESLAAHGPFRKSGEPINRQRRLDEATIFRSDTISDQPQFDAWDDEREKREKERQKAEEERQRQREAAAEHIASLENEIRQQALKNAGLDRNAFIEEQINAFKATGNEYTEEQLLLVGQLAAKQYDLVNAGKEREEAEKRVNDLLELRSALQEQLQIALERMDFGAVGRLDEQLRKVNAELVKAIDYALDLLRPLAALDPAIAAAVARLETMRLTAAETSSEIVISFEQVRDMFASGLTNAVDKFVAALYEGKSATEAAHDAFLQFAADFLREIAKMIMMELFKQAITAAMGAAHLGGVIGQQSNRRQVAIMHGGGVAGHARARRSLDMEHFRHAMRYHGGGVTGLRPGEIPTVLQRGEEVLTKDDPRHIFNMRKAGSGEGKSGVGVRVVNAFDGTDFLEQALKTTEGEQVILNFLRARGGAVRSAIGG